MPSGGAASVRIQPVVTDEADPAPFLLVADGRNSALTLFNIESTRAPCSVVQTIFWWVEHRLQRRASDLIFFTARLLLAGRRTSKAARHAVSTFCRTWHFRFVELVDGILGLINIPGMSRNSPRGGASGGRVHHLPDCMWMWRIYLSISPMLPMSDQRRFAATTLTFSVIPGYLSALVAGLDTILTTRGRWWTSRLVRRSFLQRRRWINCFDRQGGAFVTAHSAAPLWRYGIAKQPLPGTTCRCLPLFVWPISFR